MLCQGAAGICEKAFSLVAAALRADSFAKQFKSREMKGNVASQGLSR